MLVFSWAALLGATIPLPAQTTPGDLEVGHWTLSYNLATGTADVSYDKKPVLANFHAEVHLPDNRTSGDYHQHVASKTSIRDAFGDGTDFEVVSTQGPGDEEMDQHFRFYPKLDYFLADVSIHRTGGASSNYMAPIVTQSSVPFATGDNRSMVVPFDNDIWVRYDARSFGQPALSHEVTAFYNNTSREGLVIGSIVHDMWKTGIASSTSPEALTSLTVAGGMASNETRDSLPHGSVHGVDIHSPTILVGKFADWRDGMEAYADATALLAPPRAWAHGVPFGWNSWGKLQGNISYDIATNLMPNQFENDDTAYVGLDAFWNKMTDDQLTAFVANCHAHHQQAGIYFTPFTTWGNNDDQTVEGSNYKYRDIFLYANGKKQVVDNGTALDATHPGTLALMKFTIERFRRLGFTYVKADFMTHGAMEGDKHYDPQVTTGMQAYASGLKALSEMMGPDMYLNLSIAPLFPAQYANSRRISCDTFGRIEETAYELNSLNYAWWLDRDYDFNDPDHMVLGGFSEGENRARVTSAAITGLFYSGDDLSTNGDPVGKTRVIKFLTNPDINTLVRQAKSFRPVEGNTGHDATNLFTRRDGNTLYLAVFNFGKDATTVTVDFHRIGLDATGPVHAKELWSGTESDVTSSMPVHFDGPDAALYRFDLAGSHP